MNNLYISHRSLYAPTYSFEQSAACRVTSWFDTVCNIVTRWVNFRRRKNSFMNMNYNDKTTLFRSSFVQISGREIYFYIFFVWTFQGQNKEIVNNTRNTIYLGQNTSKYCNCSSCSCKWSSLKFTQRVTILRTVSNQEVTLKRLITMLPIAQNLYVGAQSDLCEMNNLFIQQCGQRYPSPL